MVGQTVGPEDAFRFARGEEVKMHSQEPAYTSPIWYSPGG